MHRESRAWNLPLGIGLFGAAVLVGGAILAYPEVHRAPSPVDVGDPIATKPFPSFPGEIPALQQPSAAPTTPKALPAPSGFGGGPNEPNEPAEPTPPASASASSSSPEGTLPNARGSTSAAPPLPAPGSTAATEAAADASSAASATTDAASTAVTDAATTAATDAATTTDAGSGYSAGDTGWTSFSDAFSAPTYNSDAGQTLPYVYPSYPAYGAPSPGAGVTGQMPVTTGAYGDAAPLWSAGSGGTGGMTNSTGGSSGSSSGTGGTGGNSGVVNPQPSITAPLLVPMAEGTQPENLWTTISPFIRGGDLVVAHTAGDPAVFLGFSERISTDTPLATYAVAFYTPTTLQASLSKLPATLSVVGLSSVGSMNEATLTAASNAVRAVGRRMFLSVNVPSTLPLATIGSRADIIELVVAGSTAAEVATNAKAAAAAIGPKSQLFVRLPSVNNTAAAVSASGTITAAMPGAGVSIPWTPNIGTTVSAYRGTTQ